MFGALNICGVCDQYARKLIDVNHFREDLGWFTCHWVCTGCYEEYKADEHELCQNCKQEAVNKDDIDKVERNTERKYGKRVGNGWICRECEGKMSP